MTSTPDDKLLTSFNCITSPASKILILGSMPSRVSLHNAEYYAHPRNSFWYIMGQLFAAGRDIPYQQRLAILKKNRIALWDVVHQCHRKGSLDADINEQSVIANDIATLLNHSPDIHHIFFNGRKAAALFRKFSQQQLSMPIKCTTLPSTSPAHASMTAEKKLQIWSCITEYLNN